MCVSYVDNECLVYRNPIYFNKIKVTFSHKNLSHVVLFHEIIANFNLMVMLWKWQSYHCHLGTINVILKLKCKAISNLFRYFSLWWTDQPTWHRFPYVWLTLFSNYSVCRVESVNLWWYGIASILSQWTRFFSHCQTELCNREPHVVRLTSSKETDMAASLFQSRQIFFCRGAHNLKSSVWTKVRSVW